MISHHVPLIVQERKLKKRNIKSREIKEKILVSKYLIVKIINNGLHFFIFNFIFSVFYFIFIFLFLEQLGLELISHNLMAKSQDRSWNLGE